MNNLISMISGVLSPNRPVVSIKDQEISTPKNSSPESNRNLGTALSLPEFLKSN